MYNSKENCYFCLSNCCFLCLIAFCSITNAQLLPETAGSQSSARSSETALEGQRLDYSSSRPKPLETHEENKQLWEASGGRRERGIFNEAWHLLSEYRHYVIPPLIHIPTAQQSPFLSCTLYVTFILFVTCYPINFILFEGNI